MQKFDLVVIIPVYNASKYIKRCLDSIFSQTYKKFLVICVDDGSKDNSAEIIKDYKNEKLILIQQKNGGPSAARNKGLDYAMNELDEFNYVTFIDADDYIDNDYFEYLIGLLENNNLDLVASGYKFVSQSKVSRKPQSNKEIEVVTSFKATKDALDGKFPNSIHTKVYRKNLLKEIRFPENCIMGEDVATIYKITASSKYIGLTSYCGYNYTLENENSLLRGKLSNRKMLSDLYSSFSIFKHEFTGFSGAELIELNRSKIRRFPLCFLEYYPRFDFKHASKEEKELILFYKNEFKLNKCLKMNVYFNKNDKAKRRMCFMSLGMYRFLFKCYLKLKGKR